MIILTCKDCGASRAIFPSQVTRYKRLDVHRCRKCWNKLRSSHPKLVVPDKRVSVIITCIDCGLLLKSVCNTTHVTPHRCWNCYIKQRRLIAAQRPKVKEIKPKRPVQCPMCKRVRIVTPGQSSKLCMSCGHSGVHSGAYKGGPTTLYCKDCGKSKAIPKSVVRKIRNINMYRCKQCALNHRPCGVASPTWKGGISRAPYPLEWTPMLRHEIRKQYDYKCVVCNTHMTTVKLAVHHIDYDKHNCTLTNLIPLCRACHTKTNFNRSAWIAFFTKLVNTIS